MYFPSPPCLSFPHLKNKDNNMTSIKELLHGFKCKELGTVPNILENLKMYYLLFSTHTPSSVGSYKSLDIWLGALTVWESIRITDGPSCGTCPLGTSACRNFFFSKTQQSLFSQAQASVLQYPLFNPYLASLHSHFLIWSIISSLFIWHWLNHLLSVFHVPGPMLAAR